MITNDRTLHHYHNWYTNKHQKYQLCFYNVKIQTTCYLRYSSASCILHTKLINWNLTLYCLPKLSIQTWILAVLSYCKILCHNQWLLFLRKEPSINTQIPPRKKNDGRYDSHSGALLISKSELFPGHQPSLWAQLSATKKTHHQPTTNYCFFVLITVWVPEVVPNKVLTSKSFHFP